MKIKIGSTTLAKITSQKEMDEFVKTFNLSSKQLIVKPNWVQPRMGTYTDAKVLEMFLSAVKKPVIILESYTFWRNDRYAVGGGDYFSSKEATLTTGKKYWEHYRKMDKWFLQATGIGEVLKKHKTEYLNITNEVWLRKVVNPNIIKKITESNFKPVHFQEIYSYIPQKLYELSGSDFISFSKAKREIEYSYTLSTKNMFGLIPDPTRYPKFHGINDTLLSQSIADINKVYRSLFNCQFIAEGVFTACDTGTMEEIDLVKDWKVIWGGKNSLEVDLIGTKLLQTKSPAGKVDVLAVSKKIFGSFDRKLLSQVPREWEIKY